MKVSITNLGIFSFFIVFLFPLFPNIFVSSHLHINVLVALVSICFLLISTDVKELKKGTVIIFYYLLLQLLLVPALLADISYGNINYSSILSFLRPILLIMTFISLIRLVENDFLLGRSIFFLITISFVYVIIELLFRGSFQEFIFTFYKRDFRPELFFVGTAFFGTSYYAGYSFLILFYLSLISFHRQTNKKTLILSLFLVLLAAVLVILAQSKGIILSLIISIYLYLLLISRNKYLKLILLFCPFVLIYILVINMDNFSSFLRSLNLSSARSLNTLITNSENSGTLNVRLFQFEYAYNAVAEQWIILGAGLGRDIKLESLSAVYLFRYGFIGLISFYAIVSYMVLISFSKYFKLYHSKQRIYPVIVIMWAITLPLSQMSSVMLEMSKMSYLSAIMFAYFIKVKQLR